MRPPHEHREPGLGPDGHQRQERDEGRDEGGQAEREPAGQRRSQADVPAAPVQGAVEEQAQGEAPVPAGPDPDRGLGPGAEQARGGEDVREGEQVGHDDRARIEVGRGQRGQGGRARAQELAEEQVGGHEVGGAGQHRVHGQEGRDGGAGVPGHGQGQGRHQREQG